ncbi:MAG: hypothetical protein HY897_13390 [Deltaproteobacteria bacterium]|nr:hypothetical protein [Deltaproteobacteria bacterium]
MEQRYPLAVFSDRVLPPGYAGPVYVWDVDKTYLSTRFSSLGGLVRIPIEFAVDKVSIPGMPEVLRGLRRGPGPGYACAPIFFVSASPPQLKKALENKMLIDGVEHDGLTFKDWAATIRAGRPGRLKEQVGYKLCALLEGRARRPMAAEYLFGDDVEHDALAFSLYARILSGEIRAGTAETGMARAGVALDDRRCVRELLDAVPAPRGEVKKVFIHLEKGRPPSEFESFGPIVVPCRGGFQLSLVLFDLGLVDADTVRQARSAVERAPGHRRQDPAELTADAESRGIVRRATLAKIPGR